MAETKNAVALYMQETSDLILTQIHELQTKGSIHFPSNYSPENALKSASLMLQDTKDKNGELALSVCTRQSVQNALYNMVLLALSPAKKQVYPIVRGKILLLDPSYFGVIAATKRLKNVQDVYAQVVFQGDIFEYMINQGRKIIVKHDQKIDNIDITKMLGAYCTVLYLDSEGKEKEYTEVMSMAQIKASWSKTSMKNNTVQQEFAEEMAKRTVIKRACKLFVNTSDDSDLVIEAYNQSTEAEYNKENEVDDEIRDKGNKDPIDVNYTVDGEDSDEDRTPDTDSDETKPEPEETAQTVSATKSPRVARF